MEANTYTGCNYDPSSSTIGIIYNDPEDDDCPCFTSRLSHTLFITPHDQGADGYITTICSTSDGLVAWYDSSSNIYYISNPLIPAGPNSFIALQESQMPHPLENSHIILATDFTDNRRPLYHIICAIQLDNECIFDTYTSENGYWLFYGNMDLEGRDIVPNTGVSCDWFAFWLTKNPHSVLRFDINDTNNQLVKFWPIPVEAEVLDMQHTRMQLGSINNQLGLVVVDASVPSVDLYLMKNNELRRYVRMGLSISENISRFYSEVGEEPFPCREMPRPIRFQSSKVEMILWVDGRLVWWGANSINRRKMGLQLLGEEGVHVVNGFAYVATWLLPGNFPVIIEDSGNEDNDHQDGHNEEIEDQDSVDQAIDDQGIHDDDNDNDNDNQDHDHQDGDDQEMEDQFQDGDDQSIDDHGIHYGDTENLDGNHQDHKRQDQGLENQSQSDHQERSREAIADEYHIDYQNSNDRF